MWKGERKILLRKTENGTITYKTIVDAVIYPDKFIITFQNGRKIPYSAEDNVIYEVLHNGKSFGILKKKQFREFEKEEKYEIYHKETGKRSAYPRKDDEGKTYYIETRVYKEWEKKKNE